MTTQSLPAANPEGIMRAYGSHLDMAGRGRRGFLGRGADGPEAPRHPGGAHGNFFRAGGQPLSGGGLRPPLCPQRPGPGKTGAGAGGWAGDAHSGGSGGPGPGPAADGKILARPPDHHFSEPAPSAPAAHRGHRDHRGAPAPPESHLPPDHRPGAPHHRHQRQSRRAPAPGPGGRKSPRNSAMAWT